MFVIDNCIVCNKEITESNFAGMMIQDKIEVSFCKKCWNFTNVEKGDFWFVIIQMIMSLKIRG